MELPLDLQKCVSFHGHLCPGVVIGYCAANLAMDDLCVERSGDEELITIVENDSCAVDAIQVLTGCTFGKGNLFFRDHGKMVFTFANRKDDRSVRLYYNRDTLPPNDESLTVEQQRQRQIEFMLSSSPATFFDITHDVLACFPDCATIYNSKPCDNCGEFVMEARLLQWDGKLLCKTCYN